MKKLLLSVPFLFLGFVFMTAQEIQVDKNMIDYGQVKVGSNGKRTFTITNTGNKPLVITNVQTSCGCTTPTVPDKPIMPGKSANLDVAYDTKRVGAFTKSITIFSNAIEKGRLVVSITGTVN